MIDAWFRKDLQNILKDHSIAVFVDESGDAEFLLSHIGDEIQILIANSEIEELHTKYLIEQHSHTKTLIYTHTKKDDLKFIREYCETNGCIEIRYLHNYVKSKVHQTLNININLPREELLSAAKISVGKDKSYWVDLSHKGASEIFDLDKELLPFIDDPQVFAAEKYDVQLREAFYRKVNTLLDQEYIPKPPETLAGEVVKTMLDGLAEGSCMPKLKSIYESWLDSLSYRTSFRGYLSQYPLAFDVDIWSVDLNHPFRQIDEKWLKEIGQHLDDKHSLSDYLQKVAIRSESKQAVALGITFWTDIKILLEFDSQDVAYLSSFKECIEFYTKHFYKLDTAIRNLYSEFLNKREMLEPFQELYKQYVSIFLEKWFKYLDDYQENQTGVLQRIIDNNPVKTAIIVGDGVAYEIATEVAIAVNRRFKLTKEIVITDIPSETENNMSRIYIENGVVERVQSNREKYLSNQNPDSAIEYVKLDEINEEASPAQYLICTYKDIDSMGEKLQQKALKFFPEMIEYFAGKITKLLDSGFERVYLISDHGFVLTGLLSESDKINISVTGVSEKAERYIRATDRQASLPPNLVEAEKTYKDFKYLYLSKNMNPFKTPGVYGFSHGGVSPQEIITPYFCWERSQESTSTLGVDIENKEELKSVTGELYQVKLKAEKGSGDLFSAERKVYLVFFSKRTQINKSDVFTIHQEQVVTKEYTFDGHEEIEVHLLDAKTKQQLDRTTIRQNKQRDLGGIL